MMISYAIDADDRLVDFNQSWTDFARANRGEQALPGVVKGRRLWDFVSDPTSQELYRRMVRRARGGESVLFRYRCDAPHERRVFTMEIRGGPDGRVEFESVMVKSEPRPAVAWLEPAAPASPELVRMCSWCARVAVGDDRWVVVERAMEEHQALKREGNPAITHGICGECEREMLRLLREKLGTDAGLNRLPA